MHALHNEADCLNHRVVTMVADKVKRQQLRGSSFGILTVLEHIFGALQFIMIEPVMVAGDSLTNVCG